MTTKTTPTTDALTTRQVAEELGTDPRTLRKFLRATDLGVGAGSRYEFKKDDLPELKKGFAAWSTKEKARADEKKGDSRLAQAAREGDSGITDDEVRAALNENTVKELQATAKGLDIAGYSAMKKGQLIDAIIAAQTA